MFITIIIHHTHLCLVYEYCIMCYWTKYLRVMWIMLNIVNINIYFLFAIFFCICCSYSRTRNVFVYVFFNCLIFYKQKYSQLFMWFSWISFLDLLAICWVICFIFATNFEGVRSIVYTLVFWKCKWPHVCIVCKTFSLQ